MKQEGEEKDEEHTTKTEKKHKKRQRKILADLSKQIEFYFSEPNLQKDRFLRQRIEENSQGCVEIATIASFNRMMQLCNDINLVIKAMKMCPSVEVIDDKWVKPAKPITEPKNVDPKTVYVERLPSHADHDWIKSLFTSCGNVVYVSLPRFKPTRVIKGFAFVEFETESAAKKALEMFNKDIMQEGDKEEDNEKEKEEQSAELTEKQERKTRKRKQKLSESENEEKKGKGKKSKHKKGDETSELTDNTCVGEKASSSKQKRKRKSFDREDSNENETNIKSTKKEEMKGEEIKSKKIKNELSESEDSVGGGKRERDENTDEDVVPCKKIKESVEEDLHSTEIENEKEKKHKKRKRKKKEKEEEAIPSLRVISKLEWLRLKEEYQKLQREAMKQTKKDLKEAEGSTQTPVKNVDKKTTEQPKETANIEVTENPKDKMELPSKLEMIPGVVLKYSAKGNIEKKKLRELFSSIAPVSYLEKEDDQDALAETSAYSSSSDIEGSDSPGEPLNKPLRKGFVRFVTKEGCKKVVDVAGKGSLDAVEIQELTDKEDVEYWERLNVERIERFQQKKRKRRGIEKIVDKMEAQAKKRDHVHFDDAV